MSCLAQIFRYKREVKKDAMTRKTICRVTNVELKHQYYHTHPNSGDSWLQK